MSQEWGRRQEDNRPYPKGSGELNIIIPSGIKWRANWIANKYRQKGCKIEKERDKQVYYASRDDVTAKITDTDITISTRGDVGPDISFSGGNIDTYLFLQWIKKDGIDADIGFEGGITIIFSTKYPIEEYEKSMKAFENLADKKMYIEGRRVTAKLVFWKGEESIEAGDWIDELKK